MTELSDDRPIISRRKTISNSYLHRLQRRHFILFDILPIVGTLAAVGFLTVQPFGVTELGLFFSMWLVTGLGITAGYHRLFTHRSYKAAPWVCAVLAIAGSMAGQGPVVSWVALHRRHHECSDREGDPHSPNLEGSGVRGRIRGLAHSHFLWMRRHDYPNVVHYAPDLLRNALVMRISRRYHVWVILGLVLPAAIGGLVGWSWQGAVSGLLWGGFVRMFVLEHIVWAINSFLHMFGTRPYESREHSRNAGILALVTFGESWHNNHHAFPDSASFGIDWYRFDPGYWLIKFLSIVGAVHDVGIPTTERRHSKRVRHHTVSGARS
ncbi:fatty acid desaturase [Rhodococcus sp. G-MC3]|uniref:acyl-CoA desaturase n=1 Tax=Rhodococcus sp. G-MC3 TaxID=3046209 RepID=UPI0024BA88EB|nr:fatty acid desaturase [Rhodococcus sp. G-MC3]MDJ0394184.1 fatty acid desaturase [Rhodococcus sp. G-MC3]